MEADSMLAERIESWFDKLPAGHTTACCKDSVRGEPAALTRVLRRRFGRIVRYGSGAHCPGGIGRAGVLAGSGRWMPARWRRCFAADDHAARGMRPHQLARRFRRGACGLPYCMPQLALSSGRLSPARSALRARRETPRPPLAAPAYTALCNSTSRSSTRLAPLLRAPRMAFQLGLRPKAASMPTVTRLRVFSSMPSRCQVEPQACSVRNSCKGRENRQVGKGLIDKSLAHHLRAGGQATLKIVLARNVCSENPPSGAGAARGGGSGE